MPHPSFVCSRTTPTLQRSRESCYSLQFLDFVRVNYLVQLSQKVPRKLVGFEEAWPSSPQPLREAAAMLREMCRMNLIGGFMKKLTPEDRAQVTTSLCRFIF